MRQWKAIDLWTEHAAPIAAADEVIKSGLTPHRLPENAAPIAAADVAMESDRLTDGERSAAWR